MSSNVISFKDIMYLSSVIASTIRNTVFLQSLIQLELASSDKNLFILDNVFGNCKQSVYAVVESSDKALRKNIFAVQDENPIWLSNAPNFCRTDTSHPSRDVVNSPELTQEEATGE